MFTGIIAALGTIDLSEDRAGVRRLGISLAADSEFLADARLGDSIAVDGACVTVVDLNSSRFEVEIVTTTLGRTIAAGYALGTVVNLERAAQLGGRLDGHLVQGHVDGIGRLTAIREEAGTRLLDFALPSEVWLQTILHGSITLNGVSLTVNTLDAPDHCGVAVIPHTWSATNLRELTPGDWVNVEGDLIGKYVRRLMQPGSNDEGTPGRPDRG